MEKAKVFEGEAHTQVTSFKVPDAIIKENNMSLSTPIVPILDINSLSEYGNNTEIGDYYASRSELLQQFYDDQKDKPRDILHGAEPAIYVSYKEEGDAEFMFDHFTLSWDKLTLYAVYGFNTTIS